MRSLRKPDEETIQSFLASQSGLEFTYDDIGATAHDPPDKYVLDHTRVRLGTGRDVFDEAKSALRQWKQCQLTWVEAVPSDSPIAEDECMAILAYAFGFWWLNACRIVYVVDEEQAPARFGFAYGTLPDHVGSGEERFLVEFDDAGDVWYDVLAFSRPIHLIPRIGYRFMRRIQTRFGPESAKAMKQAVRHLNSNTVKESLQ